MKPRQRIPYSVFFAVFAVVLMMAACAPLKGIVTRKTPEPPPVPEAAPVAYFKLILNTFETDGHVARSYPSASTYCENAALRELLDIGATPMIIKSSSKTLKKQDDTLLVRVRLVMTHSTLKPRGSTAKRRTKLAAQVRLIDASTGKPVNETTLFAPDPGKKSIKRSSRELGIAVARHIDQFMRQPR